MSLATRAAQAATAAPPVRVLLIAVGWDGDTLTPASPLADVHTDGLIGDWSNGVQGFLQRQALFNFNRTDGAFGGITVDTAAGVGRYTIPTPHGNQFGVCDTAFLNNLADSADAASRAAGIDPASEDVVAYYWSAQPTCAPAGPGGGSTFRGGQLGKRLFIKGDPGNRADRAVALAPIRQLGRLAGLPAPVALRCTDGNGTPVPLSSTCTVDAAHGDGWDVLGGPDDDFAVSNGSFSAGNDNSLGWLDVGTKQTVNAGPTPSQIVLKPLEAAPNGVFGVVELKDSITSTSPATTYWIEYRKRAGDDAGSTSQTGVIIHREVAGPAGSKPVQQLLDMSPADNDPTHAAFAFGQTWSNPLGRMKVTLNGFDANGNAVITIAQRTDGVVVPDVRYANLVDAINTLSTTGLGAAFGTPTVDPTCNNIGAVLSQSVAPGTIVPFGSSVRVAYGIAPASCPSRERWLAVTVGWDGGPPIGSPAASSKPFYRFLHGTMDAWFKTASQGAFNGFAFTDGGSYKIETPILDSDRFCDLSFFTQMFAQIKHQADDRGIDVDDYDHVAINWANNVCTNFSGRHDGESGDIYLQGPVGGAAMHEFGHAIGLHHSGSLTCRIGDAYVPLSANCTRDTYGDLYAAMGIADTLPSDAGAGNIYAAAQLNELGWLNGRFQTIQAGDTTSHVVLGPLGDGLSGLHAVKLVEGSTTFWIEYRAPVGLDAGGFSSGAEPGLLVREDRDPQGLFDLNDDSTLLLDMQPNDPARNRFGLPVGQTWVNPLGQMQITLDSVGADGAHVTIASSLVTVPDVRGLSLGAARDAITNAGLVYVQGTTTTTSCEDVNSIVGQSPAPGSHEPRGFDVTILLAVRDPKLQCN